MGALRFQFGLEQPKAGAVSERVQNAEAGKGSRHVKGGGVQFRSTTEVGKLQQLQSALSGPVGRILMLALDTDGGETVRNWGTF